jgi:hypothetical protein
MARRAKRSSIHFPRRRIPSIKKSSAKNHTMLRVGIRQGDSSSVLEACMPKALGVSRLYRNNFSKMGNVECVEIDNGGLCVGGWVPLSELGPFGRNLEGYFSNSLKRPSRKYKNQLTKAWRSKESLLATSRVATG